MKQCWKKWVNRPHGSFKNKLQQNARCARMCFVGYIIQLDYDLCSQNCGSQLLIFSKCDLLLLIISFCVFSNNSQIARFMGSTWTHLGPTGPRWTPCWPHEPCYQRKYISFIPMKPQWLTSNWKKRFDCISIKTWAQLIHNLILWQELDNQIVNKKEKYSWNANEAYWFHQGDSQQCFNIWECI